MSQPNDDKTTTTTSTPQQPEKQDVSSCPAPPEPRKRKVTASEPVVANLTSFTTAIVTPIMPIKRRRIETIPACSPSPIPATEADSTSNIPSYQALYGDDEDHFESIVLPNLNSNQQRMRRGGRPPFNAYKRRNSVTKFSLQSLQAAHRITLLEATRKTLEKLAQAESLKQQEEEEEEEEGGEGLQQQNFRRRRAALGSLFR